MNSRIKILASLREAKAEFIPLPVMEHKMEEKPFLQEFIEVAKRSGIQVLDSSSISLESLIAEMGENKKIQSSFGRYKDSFPILLDENDLFNNNNAPDVFICKGHFGVAENAAIWLDDDVLISRILAFLPEELIIILSKKDIVPTMHQAYKIVQEKDYTYGLFVAGPSKTADIEQTLVTGAQGAKNLRVFLVN